MRLSAARARLRRGAWPAGYRIGGGLYRAGRRRTPWRVSLSANRYPLRRDTRWPSLTSRNRSPYVCADAQVAELVDALVSGTSAARRGGSSPLLGTNQIVQAAVILR